MNDKVLLNAKQHCFIWKLLLEGGQGWYTTISPRLSLLERNQLSAAGLIYLSKQRCDDSGLQRLYVQTLDEVWKWAINNLDRLCESNTPASRRLATVVLRRIKNYIVKNELDLAHLILEGESVQEDEKIDEPTYSLTMTVISAYLQLSVGKIGVGVSLSRLRNLIREIPRSKLDVILEHMHAEGQITLSVIPDEHLQAEDHDAAVTINGQFFQQITMTKWC